MRFVPLIMAVVALLLAVPGRADAATGCSMVVGFSQTKEWYSAGFESAVGNGGQWQLKAVSGASIDKWASPSFSGWGATPYSTCTSNARYPGRIVLTISGDFGDDVGTWAYWIAEAVKTARAKYPSAAEIVLQPVVGGPNHSLCYRDGYRVRASYQHPYIDQAIAQVVAADPSVIAGASPEVRYCSDYRDGIGHLSSSGASAAGRTLGAFYSTWP